MGQNQRVRTSLSDAERANLRRDLETVEGRVRAIEETIQIAAWRNGTTVSEWTEKRLASIRLASSQLLEAVYGAPCDPV